MMMKVLEDDGKRSKYTTTLLLCLVSCLVTVQLMPFLSNAPPLSRTLRDQPPSTYALNIDSYSKLVSTGAETYESDVFQSGGYNWTLKLYPTGNKGEEGADHISLYVKLYNPSSSLPQGWEIYTQIKLFVQVKSQSRYLVVQEREEKRDTVQRLDAEKTEWGVGKLIRLSSFKSGYLAGDKCQFGVELSVLKPYRYSERLSLFDNPQNATFTWRILRFSHLDNSKFLYSDEFALAGTIWKLRVAPKGDGDGWRNYLSIYLELADTRTLRVNQKVYARATVTVISTNPSNTIHRQLGRWYSREEPSLGFQRFMSLVDLHDASKGFIVRDSITILIHFHLISLTHYTP